MKTKWVTIALLLITAALLGSNPLYFVVSGEAVQAVLVNKYKTAFLEQLRLNYIDVIEDESIPVIWELKNFYEMGEMGSKEIYEKYKLEEATLILNATFDYASDGKLSITISLLDIQGTTLFKKTGTLEKDETSTDVIGKEHARELLYEVFKIGFIDSLPGKPSIELVKSKNTYTEGESLSVSVTLEEPVYLYLFYRTGNTLEYFLYKSITQPNTKYYLEGELLLPAGEKAASYIETLLFVALKTNLTGLEEDVSDIEGLEKILNGMDGSKWEVQEISYEIRRK
ncbi:MAG TPA: hypothetical protein PK411_12870 [Mesotoga infera]|nr:hypothetical protein [Caldisericales bacterium]HON29126.1 hypothetical protein [Mesotoga infera]HPD39229.1 hypothetical protein [Mesotoga infera]